MKKITLSVAFGLLLGFAGSFTAKADAVLVPEFKTTAGWITLVTVVDTYASTNGIHWMYRWDDPLTPVNECGHTDATGSTTPNDMGVINVGVPPVGFGGTPAMFGDTSTTGLTIGAGFKGLITLYNFNGTFNQITGSPGQAGGENTLQAWVHEINFATGEVQAVRAPNDPIGITEGNLDDMAYGSFPSTSVTQGMLSRPKAVWMPTSIVTTAWEVIVPTSDTSFDPGAVMSATLSLSGAGGSPVVYDLNENPLSGVTSVVVECFGKVTLADFLTPLNLSLVAGGGWAYININAPFLSDRGILVYKEETALIGLSTVTVKTSANRVDF